MGGKQKLTLSSEEEIREKAKQGIVELVEKCFWDGKQVTQKDISDAFNSPPFGLSQGTVVNYLSDLVENRRLATVYKDGHRYYEPPHAHIPLPIKFGVASSAIVIILCTLANMFLPEEWIYCIMSFGGEVPGDVPIAVSFLPAMLFLLVGFIVTSVVWYFSDISRQKELNTKK